MGSPPFRECLWQSHAVSADLADVGLVQQSVDGVGGYRLQTDVLDNDQFGARRPGEGFADGVVGAVPAQ